MHMDNLKLLAYWITEREKVRLLKETSVPKPWSEDPIFQTVYFTNVNREHDKVTKWIRENYLWNPNSLEPDGEFELNIVLTRLINWPATLKHVGHFRMDEIEKLKELLEFLQSIGDKVFGNAYIVSTNGNRVGKAAYLAQNLLPAACEAITAGISQLRGPSLARAHAAVMRANGLGSFLAAQVIADLKYTKGHPLCDAEDWGEWAAEGPGSLRGLKWLEHDQLPFIPALLSLRRELIESKVLSDECEGWLVDLQNLQNCLCEFDKYCRVKNGTGRSKRRYNGVV